MKKLVSFCVSVLLAVLVLGGCSNPEATVYKASAYGVTADFCPVVVALKVDGDGKVLEGKINEYLSVYDIGRLNEKNGNYYKCGTVVPDQENGYAKFVKVGDKIFEFNQDKYICRDFPDKNFEQLMEQEQECKWYIDTVKSGKFDIVNQKGETYGVAFDVYDGYRIDKNQWADKLKNGYHEGKEYEDGYKENIYKLIRHIKNHGFYDYTGEEKPSGKDDTFKVGRYDTLVNLPNFHDYMSLASQAYSDALAQAD